jgi:hypothetical protein
MADKFDLLELHLVGGRLRPERSYACPSSPGANYYGDPSRIAFNMKKRQGEDMDRPSDREKADQLLIEWFRWSAIYRPNLGVPRVAPYCQQSTTSKQYDDPGDLMYDRVYQTEMKAVDFCIDAIAVPMQQAIGTEMRNRQVKARVWRDPGNKSFSAALDAVIVVMRKRGLFD